MPGVEFYRQQFKGFSFERLQVLEYSWADVRRSKIRGRTRRRTNQHLVGDISRETLLYNLAEDEWPWPDGKSQ